MARTPAQATANPARRLPAVDAVMKLPEAKALAERYGRGRVVEAVRGVLTSLRHAFQTGGAVISAECVVDRVLQQVAGQFVATERPLLRRVVNATGIVLHTGLGRAVMPEAAQQALASVTGYCSVQMDLETGGRTHREHCIRDLVRELTGAEDALVVNNNAGATLLVLRALAAGKEVVVSRGELIEIGGSFRLPDIMSESGAVLREVGTTNKTHRRDYEQVAGPQTGLLFKAHKSNYRIIGFTEEVGIAEIAEVGRKQGVPVVDDLGSGALVGLERYGIEHEMTVGESIRAGADVVLFSTDKLIGGPQGGLIVGRKDLLDRMRSHSLYRVLRVCKLTLAALEATLRLFRAPELLDRTHPLYGMIARTAEDLRKQAETLAAGLLEKHPGWCISIVKEASFLGGGSLPGMEMPGFAVRITPDDEPARDLAARFRAAEPPVVPYVREDAVLLNMRTVFPDELPIILQAV